MGVEIQEGVKLKARPITKDNHRDSDVTEAQSLTTLLTLRS
jgi:hypothetical protein